MARKINNTQTVYMLTIHELSKIALAVSLANNQTFTRSFAKFRLRISAVLKHFVNEIYLFFKHLDLDRLQTRLQSFQLSALTCLQVQAVSLKDLKEKTIDNQKIDKILHAGLLVNNQILK